MKYIYILIVVAYRRLSPSGPVQMHVTIRHASVAVLSCCSTFLIRFSSLSTSTIPLLEALDLTVREYIVNNVVTAHLAQPHLSSSRSALVLQNRKKGKRRDLNYHHAYCPYNILPSASLFSILEHVIRRNFCLAVSSALRPTAPYYILSFEFF
jgi:hypothetical protein